MSLYHAVRTSRGTHCGKQKASTPWYLLHRHLYYRMSSKRKVNDDERGGALSYTKTWCHSLQTGKACCCPIEQMKVTQLHWNECVLFFGALSARLHGEDIAVKIENEIFGILRIRESRLRLQDTRLFKHFTLDLFYWKITVELKLNAFFLILYVALYIFSFFISYISCNLIMKFTVSAYIVVSA